MTDETPKLKHQQQRGSEPLLVQTNVPHQSRTNPSALTTAVHQQISLNELARYIVGYLKQNGIVITQRTQSINGIEPTTDETNSRSVSDSPTHGRYFSRIGLDHFVYFDEGQESIGRDLFIEESGLFGPSSAWSVSRTMAIFRVDDETSLERVTETLTGRGFEKIEATRDALEKGFKTGDTSPLIEIRNLRPKV